MDSSLLTISGLILTVLAVMANAYWQDAVRWDKVHLDALQNNHDEVAAAAQECVKHAKGIFRVSALLGFFTTVSIMWELINHVKILYSSPAILLLIVLFSLTTILLILTVIPKYKIPIETSKELIKLSSNNFVGRSSPCWCGQVRIDPAKTVLAQVTSTSGNKPKKRNRRR